MKYEVTNKFELALKKNVQIYYNEKLHVYEIKDERNIMIVYDYMYLNYDFKSIEELLNDLLVNM